LEFTISGRVWKFGDNINTDLIIPGKYLMMNDPAELGKHAMEGIDEQFSQKLKKGDIVLGGRNFGCGSSREHAPLALKAAGVGAVVAESLARIFYRNSINLGLPVLECRGVSEFVSEGDLIVIDLLKGEIRNVHRNEVMRAMPLPEFIASILKSGGLVHYLKQHKQEW